MPWLYLLHLLGVLERYNASIVLKNYLKPVVEIVKKSKTGWPKILWVHPLSMAPFLTKHYWNGLDNSDVDNFIKKIDYHNSIFVALICL